MKDLRIVCPVLFFVCLAAGLTSSAHASLEEKIQKLPSKSFCVNADIETTWQTLTEVLHDMEIVPSLADKSHWTLTSVFVLAEFSQLRKISRNARFLAKGRFTVKIRLEEVTPAFTEMHVTMQIRQNKLTKKERLLKSRGTFEKLLAFRVNQRAIGKQFPWLYEIRLGMMLVPDLEKTRYHIDHVEAESPAGEAGFRDGDVLMQIDGRSVTIRGELFDILSPVTEARQMEFVVLRKEVEKRIPVWIVRIGEKPAKLGMSLKWVVSKDKFMVADIGSHSRASHAGLCLGDFMIEKDGISLTNWTNYYRALAGTSDSKPVQVKVLRGTQVLSLTIPPLAPAIIPEVSAIPAA
ncbi:MAG: PDZ domain-containing protein [Candidatus Omnitrophica bacterium]|nr:PDZ domain-containing protein [Candidatus Omnitrophota bacterium]MDD5670516.1 PDZ domain-containing protein [Candidatus Omnitrophota bacterium]